MIYKTIHRKLNQRRTDNTMTKRKRRSNDLQYTTQKTKSKRTDTTMTKRKRRSNDLQNNTQKTKSTKDRQYNDQKEKEKQ
jgi:hypothetical protein